MLYVHKNKCTLNSKCEFVVFYTVFRPKFFEYFDQTSLIEHNQPIPPTATHTKEKEKKMPRTYCYKFQTGAKLFVFLKLHCEISIVILKKHVIKENIFTLKTVENVLSMCGVF